MQGTPLWEVPLALRILAVMLLMVGALLATAAVNRFGAAGFVGLQPEGSGPLVRDGLHGRVRHPIYSGLILVLLGWILLYPTLPTLVVCGLMLLYLPIGIHLEECKLIATHGAAYRSYRREVPALFPRLGGTGSGGAR
jgi:protein-S-isoprenylcysteine O-methyltransferase Ste14